MAHPADADKGAARSGPTAQTIEHTLARAWGVRSHGFELLRSALILCADHELNVSSFTARCVASASSNPYGDVVVKPLFGSEGRGMAVRARASSRHSSRSGGHDTSERRLASGSSAANRSMGSAILCIGMAIRARRRSSRCSANDTPPLPSSPSFPTSLTRRQRLFAKNPTSILRWRRCREF
jgi:hypothetical protein